MTSKAESKPARRKSAVAGKTVTRCPAAETTAVIPTPAPSRRRTAEALIAKATRTSPAAPASSIRPKPSSKLGIVLTLQEKPLGASLADLVEVTGWLPHTTRAALTGLRKRGFAVVSEKSTGGGASVYRIRAEAA